jgi:hypothetical protein
MPAGGRAEGFQKELGALPSRLPKPIVSLVILQARAALLRDECDQAMKQYLAEQPESAEPRLTPSSFRLWTFLSLWLSYLWVVIEGYRESYKHGYPLVDTEIDLLLQSKFTERLRRFRNKTFHPNPYDHAAVGEIFDEHVAVREWAEQLTSALTRFFRGYIRAL